ncbi:fasciclin domain-containing protein [Roseibium sp.]|uniref:fasciclin domain-containing protein n=1 Tax=Roseibium sp. TaxID=1936156 RepID=UPI003A970F5A
MNISMKSFIRTTVAASILGLAGVAAHAEMTKEVGGAPMYPSKNIVENAVNSADHTTLVAAVKAAGLVETLSGEGPFTVFAPTNAAFEKLPAGTVETLLKPENKDQLTKILTCHVVAADAMSDAIKKMVADDKGAHPVKTVGGCVFTASTMDDGTIVIEDGQGNKAHVTIADVDQSNGVIHVIDSVLLPAS